MGAADGFDPRAAADAAWNAQRGKPNRAGTDAPFTLTTAADLVAREFREPKWAVPQIVAEGLTILAGKPKTGKSWAALDFAVAVAGGYSALGNVECQQGDVLLLALEDNDRRLNQRLKAVLQGQPAPAALQIATQWRRADAGGLNDLHAWLGAHPNARLVAIDTLQMIRSDRSKTAGVYADDYQAIASQGAGRQVECRVHRGASPAQGDSRRSARERKRHGGHNRQRRHDPRLEARAQGQSRLALCPRSRRAGSRDRHAVRREHWQVAAPYGCRRLPALEGTQRHHPRADRFRRTNDARRDRRRDREDPRQQHRSRPAPQDAQGRRRGEACRWSLHGEPAMRRCPRCHRCRPLSAVAAPPLYPPHNTGNGATVLTRAHFILPAGQGRRFPVHASPDPTMRERIAGELKGSLAPVTRLNLRRGN